MPYCKLSSGIVNSSIWSENLATRVVWITFLAIKNDIGFVEGSRTGLARIANVSIDEYDKAILVLESPDNESKNSDNEGRRIERVNGGWQVLNHDTYRDMKSDSPSAVRQRRHRESDNVTPCDMSHPVTGTVYVSVSESVSVSGIKASNVLYDPKPTPSQLEEIYASYPRKIGRGAALKKIAVAIKEYGFEELRAKVIEYAASVRGKEQQFIPHPATWFGQQRYKDEIEIVTTAASPPRATYGRQEVTKESIQAILEMELPD